MADSLSMGDLDVLCKILVEVSRTCFSDLARPSFQNRSRVFFECDPSSIFPLDATAETESPPSPSSSTRLTILWKIQQPARLKPATMEVTQVDLDRNLTSPQTRAERQLGGENTTQSSHLNILILYFVLFSCISLSALCAVETSTADTQDHHVETSACISDTNRVAASTHHLYTNINTLNIMISI